MESRKKTQRIIYWVLTGLIALVFIGSGFAKLQNADGDPAMIAAVGGKSNIIMLAVLELIIALLWIIPRTGLIGTLLGVAYLGGAIAVHFINNQPMTAAVVIQILLWLVAIYRFPELRQRLAGSKANAA